MAYVTARQKLRRRGCAFKFRQCRSATKTLSLGLAAAAAIAASRFALADTSPALFPFVIPWDDAAPGTATDVSFLNAKPAGVNGAIIVRNGHFVEANTGKQIRFIGTNFTFDANYPTHQDAAAIAAHLAKFGVNIVRIHHHDLNGGPLWDPDAQNHGVFSADGVDRLDYLIAQLKKNGVYVDLNLHVSRHYTPADGFPESINQMPENYDKRIDNIDSRMIELQKEFAREYLTHVNPYTKMSYADDPCVAVVEINNEDSLVSSAADDHNTYFEKLPAPFRGEVVAKWNQWLAAKYGNQASLLSAWAPSATETAVADALSNANEWIFEDRTGSGTIRRLGDGSATTAPVVQLTTSVKPEQSWQAQAGLAHLDLVEGALYAVTFHARADKPRGISVYSGVDIPDWHHTGLDGSASLDADWSSVRLVFKASQTAAHENRLMFVIGNDTGSVWLSDVRIAPITRANFMPAGQSLDNATIGIPADAGSPASNDFVHFLSDAETAYAGDMLKYLRGDLHVKANLIDTQMSFGRLASFRREAGSDFADDHAYWQHPAFPGRPWDRANWYIKNTPQIESLLNGETTALERLAMNRWLGRPFSVSEYNQPFPSDFQVEMFPELATFAAAQDWDMIYSFDYGRYGAAAKTDQVQDFFDTGSNPVKAAFLPAAALIFRDEAYNPSLNPATLSLSAAEPLSGSPIWNAWMGPPTTKLNCLAQRLSVTVDPKTPKTFITIGRQISVGGPSLTKTGAGAEYVAVGSRAIAAIGFVGGQTIAAGPLTAGFPDFGNRFAAMTLTALDGRPVGESSRLLLTVAGRAQNTDMVWNQSRTSVGRNWGHAPVLAEGIPAAITVQNDKIRQVWALDPTGRRVQRAPATSANGKVSFQIGPQFRTIWYELAAP